VTKRLDPEEALAGPMYFVAAMLAIVPLFDFILTVPSPEFSDAEWRFNAVGLLSGHTLWLLLGAALAFAVSAILRHYGVQRALVIACLTSAVIFALLSYRFWTDMGSQRFLTFGDARLAFTSAGNRAIIKLLLTTIAFGYMGWRARRMIPAAAARHKTPKTVHVISK
jgi:hypothetical protein